MSMRMWAVLWAVSSCSPQVVSTQPVPSPELPAEPPLPQVPPVEMVPGCIPSAAVASAAVMPDSYQRLCADCHGASGEGSKGLPGLSGASLLRLLSYARAGVANKMPSFESSLMSEADLAAVASVLAATSVRYVAEEACHAALPVLSDDEVLRQGLVAARTPDSNGYACVNCHAPDLFDLAHFDYDEATLARRALLHVDEKLAKQVFRYIAVQRKRWALTPVPRSTRVFQPGGEPLACTTEEDCDHQFGLQLVRRVPSLARPVTTLAQAQQLKTEWLAVNPRTLPIGVSLNRWTEEEARGPAHASMNEWVPDFSYQPTSETNRQALLALHDAYIASPTWLTLRPLLNRVDQLADIPAGLGITGEAKEILKEKYKSVLIGSHVLRMESAGEAFASMPAYVDTLGMPLHSVLYNPMWDVGDNARILDNGFAPEDAAKFSVAQTRKLSRPLADEIDQLRLTWFWVGWLFDHGVMHSGSSNSTKSTEYFNMHMYEKKLYTHVTYMRFQKAFSQAFRPGLTLRVDGKQQLASPTTQEWGYFLAYYNGRARADRPPSEWKMPPIGEKRQLFLDILANLIRTNILLVTEEVARIGVEDKPMTQEKIGWMRGWLADDYHRLSFANVAALSGQARIDADMLNAMDAAVAAACDNRPLRYRETLFVGHCDYRP
jgi:hypothetical protein